MRISDWSSDVCSSDRRKYDVHDPALELMADIIESGVHHVFHHHEPGYSVADLKEPVGVGLDAIAHGMLCAFPDDTENLKASMALYDGRYIYCRSVQIGRTSCRERGVRYVEIWVEAVDL